MKLFSSNGALHSEKSGREAGFFCYTRPAYLLKLIKGSQRARKWGKWLPSALIAKKSICTKATTAPGNEEIGCLSPLSRRSRFEQRQPPHLEMGKLVAFRRCPREVNLSKGNYRTLKWGNWLPPASLINLLEKRKDN
jgi:hypothetical protein